MTEAILYDVSIDETRPVTQDDVDRLMRVAATQVRINSTMQTLVDLQKLCNAGILSVSELANACRPIAELCQRGSEVASDRGLDHLVARNALFIERKAKP